MEIRPPPSLEAYQEKLAIRWPVIWRVAPDQETCRCVCDPRARRHEVWLTELAAREQESFRPDIVHELCHLALAERVDAAFSTVWFSRKWNQISREEPGQFGQAAQMLYLMWSHVDIWVNELRHSLWPELTGGDLSTFAQGVVILLQRQKWEFFSRPEFSLGQAQYQAERERHNLPAALDLYAVMSAYGVEIDQGVKRLAKHFQSLPRLKFRPRKDLKVLEVSVCETARMLELPIRPKLVFEDRAWVWDMG